MDSFRSTHVEHSNSLLPRSDSSRIDLVVERPLIRSIDSSSQRHVYYDQETPSHRIGPPPQTARYSSQDVTSHPADLRLNHPLLEHSRGDLNIRRSDDQTQPQGTPSVERPTMRLVYLSRQEVL